MRTHTQLHGLCGVFRRCYQRTTLPELVVTAGIDLTGVEVALRRGATIAGRVTGTRPEGEVLVQALRSTGEQRRFENGALVSDDGTFLIPNLPEGLYTLMAVGPGVRGVATGVAVDLGGLVHDVEVALRPHGAAGR